MEEIQNTRRLLPRRVTVMAVAGLLAVVAGVGMAPVVAADELKAETKGGVGAEATVNSGDLTITTKDKAGAEVSPF